MRQTPQKALCQASTSMTEAVPSMYVRMYQDHVGLVRTKHRATPHRGHCHFTSKLVIPLFIIINHHDHVGGNYQPVTTPGLFPV